MLDQSSIEVEIAVIPANKIHRHPALESASSYNHNDASNSHLLLARSQRFAETSALVSSLLPGFII